VTGGAGFIGSTLVDRLLGDGHGVVAYDDFSTGRRAFLADAVKHPGFRLVEGDTLDAAALAEAMRGCEVVFHLAAPTGVGGEADPHRHLEQNARATLNVLDAMRANGVRRLAFTSSGAVYGEPYVFPTPEDAPFPVQTSLDGASKLAAEALVTASGAAFGVEGCIFRFGATLGARQTRGAVVDLYRRLQDDPARLFLEGDGRQREAYLDVADCVDAMVLATARTRRQIEIFNLGTAEYCERTDTIGWVAERLGAAPAVEYTGPGSGAIGAAPFVFLDSSKLRARGWRPRSTIREAVFRTVDYLREHPELLPAPA
jgi:UDP-glucose 4-epimerase